jgi:hypothetical protein
MRVLKFSGDVLLKFFKNCKPKRLLYSAVASPGTEIVPLERGMEAVVQPRVAVGDVLEETFLRSGGSV